jgi:hypothetical protein
LIPDFAFGGVLCSLRREAVDVVIINQDLIKTAKIAAVEDDRKVSHIVEEALIGWLARRRKTAERKTA